MMLSTIPMPTTSVTTTRSGGMPLCRPASEPTVPETGIRANRARASTCHRERVREADDVTRRRSLSIDVERHAAEVRQVMQELMETIEGSTTPCVCS